MVQLIIILVLPILTIGLPLAITRVNFKKQIRELNEEFYKEAKRIDELGKRN